MTYEELSQENELLKKMLHTKDAVNKQLGRMIEDLEKKLNAHSQPRPA